MKLELTDRSAAVKCGKLYTFDIAMDPIPDRRVRTMRVWLPDSYDGVKRFPVLYMHDGQYTIPDTPTPGMGGWRFDEIVNGLEEEAQCIVVGVDTSGQRGSELLPPYKRNPAHQIPRDPGMPEYEALGHLYADFIRDTLKPLIDENFLTLPDAAHTGVGGSSMGGLQSFYMTMRDPDVFSRSLDLSPGMDILDVSCLSMIDNYDPKKLENARFYFYSGDQTLDVTILTSTFTVYRRLKDVLKLKPTQICFMADSRESHWGVSWSKYLADGIRYLFKADNSVPTPAMFAPRPPKKD